MKRLFMRLSLSHVVNNIWTRFMCVCQGKNIGFSGIWTWCPSGSGSTTLPMSYPFVIIQLTTVGLWLRFSHCPATFKWNNKMNMGNNYFPKFILNICSIKGSCSVERQVVFFRQILNILCASCHQSQQRMHTLDISNSRYVKFTFGFTFCFKYLNNNFFFFATL